MGENCERSGSLSDGSAVLFHGGFDPVDKIVDSSKNIGVSSGAGSSEGDDTDLSVSGDQRATGIAL